MTTAASAPEAAPQTIEGPAFTLGVKLLAGLLMLALLIYGARGVTKVLGQPGAWTTLVLMVVAVVALGLCYVWMLRSRTSIGPTHIYQTWIRPKHVFLVDITQVKLIFVPGLAWLISPRLVVRTREPGSIVFHAADPRVLEALVRLVRGQRPLQ